MPYNWNIQYPEPRRVKVRRQRVAPPHPDDDYEPPEAWKEANEVRLRELEEHEQHLARMEEIGRKIGLAIHWVLVALFVWPVKGALFFVKNIHQIMMVSLFFYVLVFFLMFLDLNSRIP